jgi:hypothetical protein
MQSDAPQLSSVWHVPGAPGSPWTQQISPPSQQPSTPPMQSHPTPVQGVRPHCSAVAQMYPLCTAQQTSP